MIAARRSAIAAALAVAVLACAGQAPTAALPGEAFTPPVPLVPPAPPEGPLAAAPLPPPPPSPPPEPDRTRPPWSQTPSAPLPDGAVEERREGGGRHLRLGTARGTVHVWIPAGYVRRTAGIVLYVHGYYTNVDQALVDHALIDQFRASRLNAVFVAPEAPDWNGAAVVWPDLTELLETVAARARLRLPDGPVVASGHSGAIRTVLPWLLAPRLDEIVLLDGLYRGEDELGAWLAAAPPGRRRLVLVGQETGPRTEAWLASLSRADAVRLPRIPARLGARERRAPLLYLRSQHDHMRLVTDGRVLPLLLGATPVRRLE